METMDMDADLRVQLMNISVATLSTALFRRGLRHQTVQDVRPVSPMRTNMVGPAYTLRYIPAREDRNSLEVFKNPGHLQRVAVEQCPVGHVLVIDSRKDARAASAGDILVTRLMQRGVAGIVTDGGFRDAMNIAELDMPAYHHRPSSPTNLTLHEAIELNGPIACGDVAVFPNDIMVGDADSVIVIPAAIAPEIAREAMEMTLYEQFVVEQIRGNASVIGLYPMTDEKYAEMFRNWKKGTD